MLLLEFRWRLCRIRRLRRPDPETRLAGSIDASNLSTFTTNNRMARALRAPRRSASRGDQDPWPTMFTLGLASLLLPTYGAVTLHVVAGAPTILVLYSALSAISFIFYGFDKYRATSQGWRIRENSLHVMDFFGGWPGGFFAQYCFKHKTRKTSFQLIFWSTVLLHNAAWILLFPS